MNHLKALPLKYLTSFCCLLFVCLFVCIFIFSRVSSVALGDGDVSQLVHHFSLKYLNNSAVKLCTIIRSILRMNLSNFGDPLTLSSSASLVYIASRADSHCTFF